MAVEDSSFLEGELGVFCKKDVKKGTVLFSVLGPVQEHPTKYSFALDLHRHIEPKRNDGSSDFGHYLNHSCDPNVFMRPHVADSDHPRVDAIARRDITAGEELTFDYATLEYEVTIANAVCKCNAVSCREKIQGFKDLSEEDVEKYHSEGIIPAHLLGQRAQKS